MRRGLKYFTEQDEIWAKLEAGTQAYMDTINRPAIADGMDKVLANILFVARQLPVVVQCLFPSVRSECPSPMEIEQYALRLDELRNKGAQIALVQIYSATRPTPSFL